MDEEHNEEALAWLVAGPEALKQHFKGIRVSIYKTWSHRVWLHRQGGPDPRSALLLWDASRSWFRLSGLQHCGRLRCGRWSMEGLREASGAISQARNSWVTVIFLRLLNIWTAGDIWCEREKLCVGACVCVCECVCPWKQSYIIVLWLCPFVKWHSHDY